MKGKYFDIRDLSRYILLFFKLFDFLISKRCYYNTFFKKNILQSVYIQNNK